MDKGVSEGFDVPCTLRFISATNRVRASNLSESSVKEFAAIVVQVMAANV